MSHEFINSFALDRATLTHAHEDPDALARACAHVGPEFDAVGVFLCSGWVAS
jgi:hypothetical protein